MESLKINLEKQSISLQIKKPPLNYYEARELIPLLHLILFFEHFNIKYHLISILLILVFTVIKLRYLLFRFVNSSSRF